MLRRNDDYWGAKGKPQTLVYRGIPEANARVSELLTGGVDLILPIPPDFVGRLEKTSGVTVHKATGLTIWYLGFNVEKKPFTDRKVRQAFSHAVNREAITRDILKGTGIPAVGPLLPGTWAFEPNVRKYPYDPAVAKKLLAEAGFPNGLEAELWVPESGSGMQAPVEMATVIQANLAAAGAVQAEQHGVAPTRVVIGRKLHQVLPLFAGHRHGLWPFEARCSDLASADLHVTRRSGERQLLCGRATQRHFHRCASVRQVLRWCSSN